MLGLEHTVGEREFEALGDQLLEVWAADGLLVLDLDDLEDLHSGENQGG